MKIKSIIKDERIESENILIELSIKEYLEIAPKIIDNNKFQRKRIKSANRIYANLKKDLITGCIMPPIVIALAKKIEDVNDENISEILNQNKDELLILDGLQRTYTILDVYEENPDNTSFFKKIIRIELYLGINRLGVLYRMLTLNTGQTPMSMRHQIEMLYSNFSDSDLDGITLLKEADEKRAFSDDKYNFRDILEGFNSYIERNELPISRDDILDNIQSLEKLASERSDEDIFKLFLFAWHNLIKRFQEITKNVEINEENNDDAIIKIKEYFGKNSNQVFKRSQAITGFGAAIGHLKDYGIISGIEELNSIIPELNLKVAPEVFIQTINVKLNSVKSKASKIGNAQRMYFQYFFRDLLNKENPSYLDLMKSAETALHKYNSQL